MGARLWGRAGGTSRTRSTVQARAEVRPFLLRDHAPAALLIIGLLLLIGAILAAAPAAHAGPTHDTHIWTGEADGSDWSLAGNWAGGQLPSNGDDLVFPSSELGATYADGKSVNDEFLTRVGSVTIGSENCANELDIGGSGLLVGGPIVAYGKNTWSVASTTATAPLVVQNNVYMPPFDPLADPDQPAPEFFSTLTISGAIHLVYGETGHPLTFGLGGEGDLSHDAIAVTGDVDGAGADCDVSMDGYGTVTFSGTDTWGGDTTSENGFLYFDDPASLPATSAVHLGTSDSSYGMAYFDFSGHTGTYTMPNVFSGTTGIAFRNAKVDLSGDSSGFSGYVWIPEFGVDGASSDVTVSGKLGGRIAIASRGTLRGTGTVRDIGPGGDNTAGDISPGATDAGVGVLHTTGTVRPFNGMSYTVDMTDAYGVAGIGHDYLDIGGDLWLGYVSSGGRWIVKLRSDVGGATNFDPALPYTWDIMHVAGTLSWFAPSDFVVDTSQFQNTTQGFFRVQKTNEEGGGSLVQLVYKPVDTHTWDGGAGWSDNAWSNPLNWQGDRLPSNGDDLVFPSGVWPGGSNDDFLTSVGSVDLGEGACASGSSVTTAGPMTVHMNEDSGACWDLPTTLTGDTTIALTPMSNPTGAPFAITQDISLEDAADAGHALTVDAAGESRAVDYGQLTGSDGDCSLIKQGTGTLRLGGDGGGWTGTNTWAGPTDVQAGVLKIASPGALSSHTDVHISGGAALTAEMWNYPWDPVCEDVWSNTFTGDGGIEIDYGAVTFTGASPSFTGTLTDYAAATIASGAVLGGTADVTSLSENYGLGTLYGLGAVEDLVVDTGGTLSPGLGDFGVGELTVSRDASWNGGGTYAVDVSDASGTATSGYDSLAIDGERPGLTVAGSGASPFTLFLVSSDGSTAAKCAHFDKTKTYRWHVATLSSGSISGWEAAEDVRVDSTQFATYNDLGGGTFSAEPSGDGTSVDVVFTPAQSAGPVAGFGNALACGSGYLSAPNSDAVSFSGASAYTVEMWVRPHAGATDNTTLMRQRDGGPGTEESWFAITKDRMLFGGIQSYTDPQWLFFGFDHQLPLDKWSHVAMVKTSTEVELYIDGTLVDSQPYGWPFDQGAPSKAPLTFGGDYLEGNHVPGDLDEIQVYDRALTSGDLAATYNRGLGQQSPGAEPVRYYRLDETDGATAVDAGSDGIDAALVDMGASPWTESRAAREATSNGATAPVALAYGDAATKVLSVAVVDQPPHGTVDLTQPALGRGTYTPDAGWAGTETFTYTVSDGSTTTEPQIAWVTATVPDTHTWDGGGADDDWSTAANWANDQAPSDGDSLVFPDGFGVDKPHNDAFLTSVGSISLGNGDTIDGTGVTMKGGLTLVAGSTDGLASTTLGADVTITMPDAPGRPSGPVGHAYITGDIRMVDGTGAAHALSVNVGDGSDLHHKGVISGADPACTLTKTGYGQFLLGDDAGWTSPNTWAGATSLEGGALMIKSPGALSQKSDVSLALTAQIQAAMAQGTSDTWGNVFSGRGLVVMNQWSNVTLTAASPDLLGGVDPMNDGKVVVTKAVGSRADATSRGELAGTGPVKGGYIYATGVVSPGMEEYNVATMALDGNSMFGFGARYPVDITDAAAAAGTGYDTVTVDGALTINATLLNMDFVVRPRSSDGSRSADAANFDASKPYRWHIVTTTGGVTGFTPEQFTVDATGFTNATNGGVFSVGLSADEKSLDLIFTPGADFKTGPVVGSGAGAFFKGSKQAVAWEMDSAPPAGSVFKVVADDPDSATDVLLATVPATSDTRYSYDWTIAQGPSKGWHVNVQLWSGSGESAVQYRSKDSQTFDISPQEYTIDAAAPATGVYLGKWGTFGSGDGQFNEPLGLSVAPSGDVYVADRLNHRVQYFSSTGTYKGQWSTSIDGEGQPMDVAVASDGTVYVADRGDDSVQYYTAAGDFLGKWGGSGSGDGQFNEPISLSVAPNGDVYVADRSNDSVQYFSSTGTYKGGWGGQGEGDGRFDRPTGVAVAGNGDVYVTDAGNDRVQYFDSAGVYEGQWGSHGAGDAQFDNPTGVDVTAGGDVYVADFSNHRMEYFAADGTYEGQWGSGMGTDDGQMTLPYGVSVTPAGRVYVGDYAFASRIQYFGAHGTISPSGSVPARFKSTPTFSFTPDTGYHVSQVLVDGKAATMTGENEYTFAGVLAGHTISVQFSNVGVKITPSVVGTPAHGTITPDSEQTVDRGATPTFTFAPATGYHVKEVKVDGSPVTMTGENEYTFPAVAEDHTISVEFAVDTFAITPSVVGGAEGQGTVTPADKQTVDYGATPTFTFAPSEGYHVKEVKVDGDAVVMTGANQYQFAAVKADHSISVEFALDTCQITVTAGDHGKIEPGSGPVDYGSSPTYTVTPDAGYHIADVKADGDSLGVVASVTFARVARAHTLSATFAIDTFTITPSVVGGAPGHGAIDPATAQTVEWHTTPAFTFTPDDGYRVKEVKVDGQAVTLTAPDAYTFPAVSAAHTITVEFVAKTVTITVTPGEHGAITPGTGPVAFASSPTYAITPDAGYEIADVVVDGTSRGPLTSYQFANVTEAHTISAAFTAQPGGGPTTTVTGVPAGWVNHPVTLTFAGHRGASGSPIAFTAYSVNGGTWVQGATCVIDAEGTTVVQYRSQDEAGALEDPARQATVRIDTRKPKVIAKALTTQRGTIAGLRYRVKDPLPTSGWALVRAVVRDPRGRIVTRSSSVPVAVNRWLRLQVRTKAIHKTGVYTVRLRAQDRAGNWQKGWTTVRMTVR